MTKLIMNGTTDERLMTIDDLSEMLGIPIETLYGWRHRGEGPRGYRVGRHVRYRRSTVEAWLEGQADRRGISGHGSMAYIERRRLEQRDKSGRTKSVVRYKVRYRDAAGKPHSETKRRLVDAERRDAEIELDVGNGLWRDPRRGEIRLEKRAADWIQTRHDLRLTTRMRLEITLKVPVLPRFGSTPQVRITNAALRSWVAETLAAGLFPSTIRKAVFPLRQCLEAAIADNRIVAILVAAGCNVREVSEWAGHNSVAFTLTRRPLTQSQTRWSTRAAGRVGAGRGCGPARRSAPARAGKPVPSRTGARRASRRSAAASRAASAEGGQPGVAYCARRPDLEAHGSRTGPGSLTPAPDRKPRATRRRLAVRRRRL